MRFEIHDSRFVIAGAALLLLAGCEKAVPPLPPEGFEASAALSTNVLTVGNPAQLRLTARHPAGSQVDFPGIGKGREVVVLNQSIDTQELSENVLETEAVFQLTSFRIGDWFVTTNPVVCTFADGSEKAQALPELILFVESSLNATNATKLSDIKDIVKPPLRISRKLWVPLLIAVLAAIAGLLTLAFLRKPHTILQMTPPEPPHIIARRALDALRSKPWKPEPFFTELSLIVRTYLENRFDIHAPESTTEELSRTLPDEHKQRLLPFFEQADLVKFARAGAEQDILCTAFRTVEEFVEQTTEKETAHESHEWTQIKEEEYS